MPDITQRMREAGAAVIATLGQQIESHEEAAERVFEAMVDARDRAPAPPFVIPYRRCVDWDIA
jgi:hypothetical protein